MIRRTMVMLGIVSVAMLALTFITAVSANATPTLYGTYLGGELPDYGHDITVDANGNVYMVGRTESLDFPTGTLALPMNHGIDVFVAKFNYDGSQADYILWFFAQAFNAIDEGNGIVVDDQGYAYVAGHTGSDDFCEVFGIVPGYDTVYNGDGDGFLLKIDPDGNLVYCTFLGGSDWDTATAVAIDEAGNAYVTGGTWSTNFVTSTSTINDQHAGERDAYLVKIDPTGTAVLHSSLLGGASQEESRSIGLDADGNAYVTGWTRSSDFITTTGVFGPSFGGEFDAFLVKINTTTPALAYATYLGGTGEDRGNSLVIDDSNQVYIGGLTRSSDFPTTPGAYEDTLTGLSDAFIAKVNSQATALSFSTYLGGSDEDHINDITLDANNFTYATGETWSTDFPTTTEAFSPTLTGGRSAFVVHLDSFGSQLAYSTFLGGSDWDRGLGIAQDGFGSVFISGATRSPDFPVSSNAFSTTHTGDYDSFFSNIVFTNTNPTVANFIGTPTSGDVPLTVQFTNLSTGNSLTSTWDFGDGTISSLDNPTHTYQTPGTYTVTLTAGGPGGTDTLVRSNYIEVQPPQPTVADFTGTPTNGRAPLTVQFTNLSTGSSLTHTWDFGDGTISNLDNPTHTYEAPGTYTVTLTASGTNGTDTRVRTNYIQVQWAIYLPVVLRP